MAVPHPYEPLALREIHNSRGEKGGGRPLITIIRLVLVLSVLR